MEQNQRLIINISVNNSSNYDKRYMKIKFNSEDDLPLKETLIVYSMVTVDRSVFHEDNK